MSGGFSDAERERIREGLVAEGRELFSRYGLSKTTLADLTDPVGIATSTFYQFFDSKEALYLEILEREGEELLPRMLAPFEEHDDPENAIVGFLTALMDEIETNPLMRQLVIDSDELDRLREHHTEAELREEREQSLAYFLPYVEAWYEAGQVEGPSPETVANAIRSVSFLTLHQEDIGEDRYRETRDLVIRAVAKGLTA
ncbi:TetR/AcrR family transcriptional regulator [Haloarchaeobius litoreus]|uniref:TetR/AcrR family transcriptional regulator n=1 Tax=Haloarchaeobius litoreus TaxID=755306 RepID=A0ABD6DF40_9EURY|nr:TetR/AcrR family transcriptional regulator [Haloarchaeobius litoreus]